MAAKLLGTAADDGISVDAQMGDRQNEGQLAKNGQKATGNIEAKDKAQVTVNNSQQNAEAKIDTAEQVTVQNVPPWVMLLVIVGWVLPTPNSIWKGVKNRWQRHTHKPT